MEKLPLFFNLGVIVFFGILGFFEAKRLFKKNVRLESKRNWKNYWGVLLSVITLVVFLLIAWIAFSNPSYAWNLPLSFQYYYTPFTWGISLAGLVFVFTLNSVIAVLENHLKRKRVIMASLFLLLAVEIFFYQKSKPIAHKLEHEVMEGMIVQTSGFSCVPAVCANILKINGIEKTEKEMAVLMSTTVSGTNYVRAIYEMEKFGYAVKKVEIEDKDFYKISPPAM
ncbi:MAG: hypothetical protein JW928_06115, partial [Candidatus Aureabacteria bacterium]|nr:hypothetical protein [Candidatus Auribacterota bacterium]